MKTTREIKITVNTLPLPSDKVYGVSRKDDNDKYTIYINADQAEDKQAAAFLHEMLHIWNDDFTSEKDADKIEQRTHEQMKRISDMSIDIV